MALSRWFNVRADSVAHAEVVDNKGEDDIACIMLVEPMGKCAWPVASQHEDLLKLNVRDLAFEI